MRQFKERTRKVKEVTSIVCNKCGRVIPVVEIILTFVNPVMMN